MLGTSSISVKEKIIIILSERGPSTASWILSKIQPIITKQSIYQELRHLMEDGIVIKVKKLYSLRFAWVLKLHELTNRMYTTSLNSAETLWLPTEKRKVWKLPDIRHALQLWSHLSMLLFKTTSSRYIYEYAPHAWYHLINSDTEKQFQAVLKKENINFYLIVGSDTFLDRSYQQYFKISGAKISFSESCFSNITSEYFSVIGDNIIRVILPLKLSNEIDNVFSSTDTWGAKEIIEINKVLSKKTDIRIEVIKNPLKSAKLTKQFREFFGI